MNTQKGMGTGLVIALVAGALALGSLVLVNMQPQEEKMHQEGEAMMQEGEDMMNESMTEDGAMMEEVMEEEVVMKTSDVMFSGTRLAGSVETPLLEYNDKDFEKALASDKLIALYFYANWCPTCKAEFPKMEQAFDELNSDSVVGFRVNFKDNQTSNAEEALAREHGVGYQHTKVFIQNGERIFKSPESWGKDRYINEITSRL